MPRMQFEWDRVTAGFMVLAAATLWGTAGVASRWLHEAGTATTLEIGFWRLALALPLIAIAIRLEGGRPKPLLSRVLPLVLVMGLGLAGFQVGYFGAIGAMGVAVATLMAICTIPVFTALLARPVFGDSLGPGVILGLVIACGGAALVVTGARLPALPGGGGLATGLPLALLASLSFAGVTLAGRAIPAGLSALQTTGSSLLVAAGVLGGLMLLRGEGLPKGGYEAWLILGWIALLPTALAYVLFYTGVRRVRSSTAGIVILAEPLSANLLAWWLHDERLGPAGWLGAGLLLTAMLVVSLSGPSHEPGQRGVSESPAPRGSPPD